MPAKAQPQLGDVWIGQQHLDEFAKLTGRDLRNSRGLMPLLEKAINAIRLGLELRQSPDGSASIEVRLDTLLKADFESTEGLYQLGRGRRSFLSQFQAWLQA
jgi:hypothetical protein